MKKIKVVLLCLFLYGCQTVPNTSILDTTSTVTKKEIVVDQEAMKDCEPLKDLPFPATFETVLDIYGQNVQIYVNCKKQNDAKKKILQEYILGK